MEQQTYQAIPGLPPPSSKDHTPYIKFIEAVSGWSNKNNSGAPGIGEPVADFIIYLAFLILQTKEWTTRVKDAQTITALISKDRNTRFSLIASALSTPKVQAIVMLCLPNLDREKYFPHNNPTPAITQTTPRPAPTPTKKQLHKRGELWKADPKWDHLCHSSHAVFLEILRRHQFTKRRDSFPWCQIGVRSLVKFTCYKDRQIRKALQQLERFKLIKRIYRAYKGQGPSKYFVFITPSMSAAFSQKSLHAKKRTRSK